MSKDHTKVLAAVIVRDGRYLVCKRPEEKRHGGLWEFPGGKLEGNESHIEAATRELKEELDLTVTDIGECLFRASDKGSPFVVEFCEIAVTGAPKLLEHTELCWLRLEELLTLNLAPTDAAFVKHLSLHGQ